ncbi:DUF4158 domain-containing protein [Streptomyces sp. NPDC056697]|uniref:DUF4158 domain-containing protein n=1 Tax=Streptomyces sp. NPDC056697 TaxID=3345915 RepID=UPI0036A10038
MVVASVERTAYPRFKRVISERELAQFFTPDGTEIAWAAKRTHDRPESLLALLVLLKSYARLGYFPGLEEVPYLVVARVRATAGLPEDVVPVAEERTAKRYRSWVRERLGLVHDPARVREIAMSAMEEAAPVRASVVELVNVALEELVRAGLDCRASRRWTGWRPRSGYGWRARSALGSPSEWALPGSGWRACWWCRTVSAAARSM